MCKQMNETAYNFWMFEYQTPETLKTSDIIASLVYDCPTV